jgi:hypothetical protein
MDWLICFIIGLDLPQGIPDPLRRLLGFLREFADFFRYNIESPPLLPGVGSLNGCINPEQIRLVGDLSEDSQHFIAFFDTFGGRFRLEQQLLRVIGKQPRALCHMPNPGVSLI